MKKSLLFLLVISLLLSCCTLFSSCSKVSAKKAQKDAQAVLADAFDNTVDEFFQDDADLLDVIEEAMKSGSISVSVESDTLMGNIKKVTETLYMNEKEERVVSDTLVKYGEEDLTARIYLDKTGLILNSEAILGSSTTYAAKLSTLIENLSGGALAELLGANEEQLTELNRTLSSLKTELEKDSDDAQKDLEKRLNEYLALLDQTSAEEKTAGTDNKEVKCVVMGYSITKETVRRLIDKVYSDQSYTEEEKTAKLAELDAALEDTSFNFSLKVYINRKTSQLVKIALSGSRTYTTLIGQTETESVNFEMLFGKTEIALTAALTGAEESVSYSAKITKETSKASTDYRLEVKTKEGDIEVNLLNATYTYHKDSGAFTLSLDLYNEGAPRTTLSVDGTFTVTKKDATIAISSIKTPDATVSIQITLTFVKEAETPAAPTDAKDIALMSREELQAMLESFQKSKLMKLLSGIPLG